MNKRLMVGVLVFSLVLMLSVGGVSALSLPGWLEDVLGLDRVGLSPSDLELHLEFENDLTDSSGNGRDGSCSGTGCPGAGVGKIGNGGEFDNNDHVNVDDFDYGPDFTIAFWFNQTSNAGTAYQYMFSHGPFSQSNSVNVYMTESGSSTPNILRTTLRDSVDSNLGKVLDVPNMADLAWHHYVLVVDASGSKVYIDGVERASSNQGGASFNPSTNIYIGGREDLNFQRYYYGLVDDLRIFGYALSAQEISYLYNNDDNACQDLFNLVNSKLGNVCGDSGYDKVADVDKDGDVDSVDAIAVVNRQTDIAWCQERLDDTTDPCVECQIDSDCNDYDYCTGVENCVNGACVPGTPIVCDDGIACTVDSCDDETAGCIYDASECIVGDVDKCGDLTAEFKDYVAGIIESEQGGTNPDEVILIEGDDAVKYSYIIVPKNPDNGAAGHALLNVKTIVNSSTGFSSDRVTLQDVQTGLSYDVSITAEGQGTVSLFGNTHRVTYKKDDVEVNGLITINWGSDEQRDTFLCSEFEPNTECTDSDGAIQTAEIVEGASKVIDGLEVKVVLADESTATNRISAELLILNTDTSIYLSSDANPWVVHGFGDRDYGIDLVSATDTSATLQINSQRNYGQMGVVSEGDQEYKDYCLVGDPNQLIERYCDTAEDGTLVINTGSYTCENGCAAGACVSGPEPEVCDPGCSSGGSCVPTGFRVVEGGQDSYCDLDGALAGQKSDGLTCQNNFECLSNQCSNGECVGLVDEIRAQAGTLTKIWCWITNLLDSAGYDQCLLDAAGGSDGGGSGGSGGGGGSSP